MAAFFVGASTQYLSNSNPAILDYPFSVGMWFNLSAVAAVIRSLFSLSDTATSNNFLSFRMDSNEKLIISSAAGGTTSNSVAGATAIVAGQWTYAIARFINSTNRKIGALRPGGLIEHATTATARAPTGLDTLSIGATQYSLGLLNSTWDGLIGELWYTDTDIQPDGAQLDNNLLRQLAYGGPFSIPSIAKDIIEYRSLRVRPQSDGDRIGEVYFGKYGRQTWSNINGVTAGPHPPLPYWFKKPGQRKLALPV